MQADGEDAPRTGRARTLRHRHARQLAARAMASMGRMEGAKRVRRRRGMGCVGRQREKPARHGGRASTMPARRVSGRIVEACAKASRNEDEFIRRVRKESFSIIDPRLAAGNRAKDSFDPGGGRLQITWLLCGRVDQNGSTPSSSATTCDETTARRLGPDDAEEAAPRPCRNGAPRWRTARPSSMMDANAHRRTCPRTTWNASYPSVLHRRQSQQRGGRRRIPGSDARGPAHVRHAARTLRNRAGIRSMEHGRL